MKLNTPYRPPGAEQRERGATQMTPNSYKKITPKEAKALMDELESYVLLDVRTGTEFSDGHIEGAILLPLDELALRAGAMLPDRDAAILVYCRSGGRSRIAAQILAKMGYARVFDLGGIIDWPYGLVK